MRHLGKILVEPFFALFWGILSASSLSGQTPAEVARYERLVAEYFDYYERGVNDSAELALRQALLLLPEHRANFLLRANLAELVVSRRDTLGAVSLLSEALAEQPDMEEIRSRRAELFEKSGKSNEALADLEALLAKRPDNEVYRYRRALVLLSERLWNGAAAELELIVKNNPQGYLPRVTLAAADFERGLELEAEKTLTGLRDAYPDLHIAARVLTGIYLRQGRRSAALETIRKVINEGRVVTAEDYLARAVVWLALDEEEEAAEDFATAKEKGASDELIERYRRSQETIWNTILIRS